MQEDFLGHSIPKLYVNLVQFRKGIILFSCSYDARIFVFVARYCASCLTGVKVLSCTFYVPVITS